MKQKATPANWGALALAAELLPPLTDPAVRASAFTNFQKTLDSAPPRSTLAAKRSSNQPASAQQALQGMLATTSVFHQRRGQTNTPRGNPPSPPAERTALAEGDKKERKTQHQTLYLFIARPPMPIPMSIPPAAAVLVGWLVLKPQMSKRKNKTTHTTRER